MNEQTERAKARAHYAAAAVGGFLGLYPLVSAAHILGSAQTSNLIEIVLDALLGNVQTCALHALGALIYVFSITLATILERRTKINLKLLALIFDFFSAVCMFLTPPSLPVPIYLYPTFFALPFHWCAFKGAYGFVSATIFSTNNLRMFVSAVAEITINGDRSFSTKAFFFGFTLLFYHAGIVFAFVFWKIFGSAGFLFSLIPILICAFFCFFGTNNYGK